MPIRPALTLIEVVASLALAATTATALLLAQSRALSSMQAVGERQMAGDLAHELLVAWKLDPPEDGPATQGSFESHADWSWQRISRPYLSAQVQSLQEVQLRIVRTQRGESRLIASYTFLERADEPL